MASSSAPIALFLALNLLFFTLTAACGGGCNPTPKPPTPRPRPTPTTPTTPSTGSNMCPIDTLKLGACADVLSGLLNINQGQLSSRPCCSLIQGLVDVDAAVCLCSAIRANVLGINLNVPVSLSLLLDVCNKKVPQGFRCA